jgi:hypothetical protein
MQEFLQFLFDTTLTTEDINLAKAEVQKSFHEDPGGAIQQSIDLRHQMVQLRQQQDVQMIGMVRSTFLYHFYNAYHLQGNDGNIGKLLKKYITILTIDPINQLALTSKDVESLCDLSEFIGEINEQPVKVTKEERHQAIELMSQNFSKLSVVEKKLMCSMGLLYPYLRQLYNQASPAEKIEMKNQLVNQDQLNATSTYDLERDIRRQKMILDMDYRWLINMRNMFDDKFYWEIKKY